VSTALVGDVPTALTALFLRRERFRRDFARREWKGTADPNSVASLARGPSRGRIRARLLTRESPAPRGIHWSARSGLRESVSGARATTRA